MAAAQVMPFAILDLDVEILLLLTPHLSFSRTSLSPRSVRWGVVYSMSWAKKA
jgi:hypothetical protein